MKTTIAVRNVVPFWVVNHLGKKVELVKKLEGDVFVFEAGAIGTLDSITTQTDGTLWAVVVFDADPTQDWTYVPFDSICMPADDGQNTLREICFRIPGRAGEIAHLWTKGIDPRDRLSRNSYYRYRRELIGYGIDITRPYMPGVAPNELS